MENYDASNDLEKVCARYFLAGNQEISPETLRGKLNVLLDWGIKRHRISPHRPYLVAVLIKHVLSQPGVRKALKDNWIESHMWTWIDQACETTTGDMATAARTLVAELFNREVLSFSNYLERMIALGRTFRHSTSTNNISKYLDFVSCLQLADLSQSLITLQRNISHGFEMEAGFQDRDRQLQQALTGYLNQAQGIHATADLKDCALSDVPAILLDHKESTSFARCCRRLRDFRPVPIEVTSLDTTVRLGLLVHLFEVRGDYRLLLELLGIHWRKLGTTLSKPIRDAIQRHRLLISCFCEEDPELYAASWHRAKEPWVITSVLWGSQRQVNGKQQQLGIQESDPLQRLCLASRTTLDTEAVTSLWTLSIEIGSLQPDTDARADLISKMADQWLNVACVSAPAWRAHLESWMAETNPASATYEATSALCVELVFRGAMEPASVWDKLVYPFLDSPARLHQHRSQLQVVASLCARLLIVDDEPIRTAQDLLLRSAIASNHVGTAGRPSAASLAFLQHLPSMLLLMNEFPAPGRTKDISAIATSCYLRSLASKYENKTRQSFSVAVAEMPEKRSLWASTLDLLLSGPKEGV